VYLVGFIIRIYHDARSPERQTVRIFTDRNVATVDKHMLHFLNLMFIGPRIILIVE